MIYGILFGGIHRLGAMMKSKLIINKFLSRLPWMLITSNKLYDFLNYYYTDILKFYNYTNQWSTTGLSKAVVCTVLSMEKCI